MPVLAGRLRLLELTSRRSRRPVIVPVWVRLARSTWLAWSSIERLRWHRRGRPSRAIAMAIRDSVTVSMAALISGTSQYG